MDNINTAWLDHHFQDEYSTPNLGLWQRSSTAPTNSPVEEISQRFDTLLQTGVYDDFFDEAFLRNPVAE